MEFWFGAHELALLGLYLLVLELGLDLVLLDVVVLVGGVGGEELELLFGELALGVLDLPALVHDLDFEGVDFVVLGHDLLLELVDFVEHDLRLALLGPEDLDVLFEVVPLAHEDGVPAISKEHSHTLPSACWRGCRCPRRSSASWPRPASPAAAG